LQALLTLRIFVKYFATRRPVGKIVPIQSKDLTLEERIKVLEDQGLIEKQSTKRMMKIPSPIPVADNMAQKCLQEDREYEQ
jgi:hypothetical protein